MRELIPIATHEVKLRFLSKTIAANFIILLIVMISAPWIPKLINSEQKVSLGIISSKVNSATKVSFVTKFKSAAATQNIHVKFIEKKTIDDFKELDNSKEIKVILVLNPTNFDVTEIATPSATLTNFLINYSQKLAIQNFFAEMRLDFSRFQQYLFTHSASVFKDSSEDSPPRDEQYFTAMIMSLLLFTLIVLAGTHLVIGVVEEKSSHVLEIILYSISPRKLLGGKLLGISAFVFSQFTFLTIAGASSAYFAGTLRKLNISGLSLLVLLIWLPLGFTFFAILFAAAGARTNRVEEIGSVQAPLMLLLSTSLYAAIFAFSIPDAQWVKIAAQIPPFSFFIEPGRYLLNQSTWVEEAVSLCIGLLFTIFIAVWGVRSFEKRVFLSPEKARKVDN